MVPRVCARTGCSDEPDLSATPRVAASLDGTPVLRIPVYLCTRCSIELAGRDLDAELVPAHR